MILFVFSWPLMCQQMLLFSSFIHGVSAAFEVTEEVASVNSLFHATTAENIFQKITELLGSVMNFTLPCGLNISSMNFPQKWKLDIVGFCFVLFSFLATSVAYGNTWAQDQSLSCDLHRSCSSASSLTHCAGDQTLALAETVPDP